MALQKPFSSLLIAVSLIAAKQVAAQTGDGGATSGNIAGSSNGAGGPSQSSANLSTGAIVAIAIIVAVVVFLGVTTAYLFLSAKKRQWTMREQLRHSRRRVTTGLKAIAAPLTPGRGILSPVKTRFSAKETAGLRDESPMPAQSKPSRNFSRKHKTPLEEDTIALRGRDLEKGEPVVTAANTSSTSREGRQNQAKANKEAMRIELPKRGAAIPEPPQTPMWNKILGRT